jgi:hypothetical protein
MHLADRQRISGSNGQSSKFPSAGGRSQPSHDVLRYWEWTPPGDVRPLIFLMSD